MPKWSLKVMIDIWRRSVIDLKGLHVNFTKYDNNGFIEQQGIQFLLNSGRQLVQKIMK